ncbi:MAG: SH3 domain-containing protein [Anaerolineae bacterium]
MIKTSSSESPAPPTATSGWRNGRKQDDDVVVGARHASLTNLLLLCLLLSVPVIHAQDEASPDGRVQSNVILRLQTAPSLDGAILTVLEPSTPLTITGLSLDRAWLQVVTPDNQPGWVLPSTSTC